MFLSTKLMMHGTFMILYAIAGATATMGAGAAEAEGLSAMAIAAACAGSASTILFLILNQKERPPERTARRVFWVLAAFALGATFGLFVGPSIANSSPLDRVAGIYFGGLVGFGVIGVVVSPKTMKALGAWVVSILTQRGGAS